MGEPCRASGNHITQGTKVSIRSGFDDYTLYQQWKDGDESAGSYGKDKNGMPKSDPWLDVPIIGSVLAHDVGNYWNSLCKVTNGDCEWYDD